MEVAALMPASRRNGRLISGFTQRKTKQERGPLEDSLFGVMAGGVLVWLLGIGLIAGTDGGRLFRHVICLRSAQLHRLMHRYRVPIRLHFCFIQIPLFPKELWLSTDRNGAGMDGVVLDVGMQDTFKVQGHAAKM